MEPISKYLDAAQRRGKLANDSELARRIGVSRQAVSKWRHGDRAPSPDEARIIEELAGLPTGMLMAECEAARAKDSATKAAWLKVARMCSGRGETVTTIALCVLAFVVLYATGDQEWSIASIAYIGSTFDNTNYRVFVGLIMLVLIATTFQKRHSPLRSWRMIRLA